MSDELERDPAVARALEGIPVPGYEPGFWDRLGDRLDHEAAPGRQVDGPHVVVVPVSEPAPTAIEPIELPAPVPLPARGPARRERRRGLVALAAAAAAVLAIVAVRIGEDEPGNLRVAGGETEGGTQLGPDDGTTTPDAGPELEGAQRAGDDDDGPDAGAADDRPGDAGPTQRTLFSASTTVVGGVGGGTVDDTALALAPKSPQEAFLTWARAIDAGDVDTAVALTGPRTIRYYDALGTDIEDVLAASGEGWGVWADPDGRHIQAIELGEVDGERAVGLVLDRPSTDDEDADGRAYEGIPVVRGTDGWKVEPAAFDPSSDGRIEVVAPAPGPEGLQPMAKGASTIRVTAQPTGSYYLNLDLSQSATIAADDAVDGEIAWTPSGLKSTNVTRHLLVVAHLDEGQVTMLAQTFETAPA